MPSEASFAVELGSDELNLRKVARVQESKTEQEPVKDEDGAHPIANAWKPALREIIKAFVEGDYELTRGIPSVAPVSKATADQIRMYIADYGETLAELPDETWGSSVSQWMGTHWDVLVDLWTVESGESDMVLSARVFEVDESFRIEIDSVHVP